jgi:AcrR family transcriptional regulator
MFSVSDDSAAAGRRSRTPSSVVERELLAAAVAVLERDGPGALTVRAVASQAGIAPMGVYNRLGGKSGLVEALLVKGFDGLRAAMESSVEQDLTTRLRVCGLRYREFALANRHFYAIMFQNAIPHDLDSEEVAQHASDCFGALVRTVELAAAGGVIIAPDTHEVAQQIWSVVHGAVALELDGLVQTPDPAATYAAMLDLVLRGLAPEPAAG